MTTKRVKLMVSDDKKPLGSVKPGQKLEVVAVTLSGRKAGSLKKMGARLCGGTSTCLALTDIE